MASGIPLVHGWQETLLCVHDPESWIDFYEQVAGWQTIYAGELEPLTKAYLGFDNHCAVPEILVGKPGANFGHVRLLQPGRESRRPIIRSCGQPWDTGGWFDLNARVEDMDECVQLLQDRGWAGATDPVQYDFGPYSVIEWVAQGPDGVALALMERLAPPLDPASRPGRFGTHFNSTQVVDNFAAARQFYGDVLGFEPVVELREQPITNVLGLPNEAADRHTWNVAMLKAPGNPGGSVEILELTGISGRDFSNAAQLPNRGIIGHRFPADDIQALFRHLQQRGTTVLREPQPVSMHPHGTVTMMSVAGPCGARLDFYQQ